MNQSATGSTRFIQKYECGECGAEFTKKALDKATAGQRRYCPNCGALIRGIEK